MTYEQYLVSDEWRGVRDEAFKFYGRRCQVCGSVAEIQGHHLFYPRPIENTEIRHLMPLCDPCHGATHRTDHAFTRDEKLIEQFRARIIEALRRTKAVRQRMQPDEVRVIPPPFERGAFVYSAPKKRGPKERKSRWKSSSDIHPPTSQKPFTVRLVRDGTIIAAKVVR